MGFPTMREPLPNRRNSWTQKVHIGGQTVYLTVGEYNDGRPGEIWVVIAKDGSTMRGVIDTLSRAVSVALQHGASIELVANMLRGYNYTPNGPVQGSSFVQECDSITDWIASELEAAYLQQDALGDDVETVRMPDRAEIPA